MFFLSKRPKYILKCASFHSESSRNDTILSDCAIKIHCIIIIIKTLFYFITVAINEYLLHCLKYIYLLAIAYYFSHSSAGHDAE